MNDAPDRNEVLVKKSLIYLIGNFSSKILGTLIIPIYAAYLTANELGNYDYQQSIGNFVSPIFALAIWEAILRFGLGKPKKELNRVISSALIVFGITLSVSIIILSSIYLKIYGVRIVILLYIMMIVLMPILTIWQYTARASGNSTIFVKSSIIASFSNLGSLFIFVILLKGGLMGLLISTNLANIVNIIYISFKINIFSYFSKKDIDSILIKSMLIYSVPLALNLMSVWFITGFSRFYTNIFLGSNNNGIYAFASKFSMILATLSQVVNMAIIEDTVLNIGEKNFTIRFEKTVNEVTSLLFLIIICLIPVISIYYIFVPNSDYKSSLSLVPILLYSTLLQNCSTVTGNIFNAYNKTFVFFYTTLFGSLLNVIFTFFLGSRFGLQGVAFSQIIGFFFLFLSRYLIGKRIANYKINWKVFSFLTFIYVGVTYISLQQNSKLNILLIIGTLLFLIIRYKAFFTRMFNRLLKR